MEERKKQYAKIKRSMNDFGEWLDGFLPPKRVEFIQRPAEQLQLPRSKYEEWQVNIDIVRFVEGVQVVSRFATVYGKDKFEAKLNASAICRIEEL